jgi:hypothetical protein
MQNDSKLYPVEEPEQTPERRILHLTHSSDPAPEPQVAAERPVERPWPRQHAWRNLQRQLTKNVGRRGAGKDKGHG